MAFKEAIARHYKAERDRAEACLGDIIKILDQEGDQVEQILNRLIRHYSRMQGSAESVGEGHYPPKNERCLDRGQHPAPATTPLISD